ncbi:hypothetical protein I4U23_011916 [Adineta vaga]|nr:hypothetical protein I4U23_011916 [Adineta vaga]
MANETLPSSSIIIRSFQPSDLPHCQEIFAAAHREYNNPWEYIHETLQKDMADIEKNYLQIPNGHYWVAVSTEDNRIVGQVALQPLKLGDPSFYKEAPEDERDQTCELLRMATTADVQRKGVGNKLLSTLLNFAREKGYHRLHLTTLTSMHKACGFYEKNGFIKGRVEKIPMNRNQENKIDIEELSRKPAGYTIFEVNSLIPEEDQQMMKLSPSVSNVVYIQHFSRML